MLCIIDEVINYLCRLKGFLINRTKFCSVYEKSLSLHGIKQNENHQYLNKLFNYGIHQSRSEEIGDTLIGNVISKILCA